MGEKIRLARITRHMTQRHLALFAGRSSGWMSLVEHDRIAPHLTELERIAAALGMHVRDLLPPEDGADR